MTYIFKEGDVVRVYSLQSFFYGGFINGTIGIVKQDQIGGSVLVRVERNFGGTYKENPSYEVYPEQLRLVRPANTNYIAEKNKTKGRKKQIIDLLKKLVDLIEKE